MLGNIPTAHTDTDIYIKFQKANVLHLGDVFFNGMYPFIDATTGGSINGMIDGVTFSMKQADEATKIVPGHGPLGDLAALTRFRDMLVTVARSHREAEEERPDAAAGDGRGADQGPRRGLGQGLLPAERLRRAGLQTRLP